MNRQDSSPQARASLLADAIRQARLWWRLLWDERVPGWTKAVPVATVLYLLFPVDIVPDLFVGLGQLDDLAIFLLGMQAFVALAPAHVVAELRRELGFAGVTQAGGARAGPTTQTVDAPYRVVDDAPPAGQITPADGGPADDKRP